MRRIAQISDLHFGRHIEKAVEDLRADLEALAPDIILVSGDLTQRAKRREFHLASAFLESLANLAIEQPEVIEQLCRQAKSQLAA